MSEGHIDMHLLDTLCVCVFQVTAELWLVTEDYTAQSDRELTVSRGQQVELVDAQPTNAPSGDVMYYLIRLANPDTADWASAEGLVPSTVLKQLPGLRGSGSRSSITIDGEGTAGECCRLLVLSIAAV